MSFFASFNCQKVRQCVSRKISLVCVPRKSTLTELRILTEMLNGNGTGNKYKIFGITGITRNKLLIQKKFLSKKQGVRTKFWSVRAK